MGDSSAGGAFRLVSGGVVSGGVLSGQFHQLPLTTHYSPLTNSLQRAFGELVFLERRIDFHVAEEILGNEAIVLAFQDRADLQPGFDIEIERQLSNALGIFR